LLALNTLHLIHRTARPQKDQTSDDRGHASRVAATPQHPFLADHCHNTALIRSFAMSAALAAATDARKHDAALEQVEVELDKMKRCVAIVVER
jgi:hypothetical protein